MDGWTYGLVDLWTDGGLEGWRVGLMEIWTLGLMFRLKGGIPKGVADSRDCWTVALFDQ
ncbi:MAG: hypothetical protein HWE14_06865 [Flavobacteriia bacterium]|nr:hypothetical protein [Flavobacteriia bacterium]